MQQKRFDLRWPILAVTLAAACSRTGLDTDDPPIGIGDDAGFAGNGASGGGGRDAGAAATGGTGGEAARGGDGGAGRGGTGGVGGTGGMGATGGTGASGASGGRGGGGGTTGAGGSGGSVAGRGGSGGSGAVGGSTSGAGGIGGTSTGGSGRGGAGGPGGSGGSGALAGSGVGGMGGLGAGGSGGTGAIGGGTGGGGGFAGSGGTGGGPVDAGAACGNGVVEPGEQCDLGAGNVDRPAFVVTQGGSVGVVPIDRVVSASLFYGLSSASSHTGLEVVSTSRIYLYRDVTTGILSLVMHHGIDRTTSGQAQPSSRVVLDITSLPVQSVVAVTDDAPNEFFKGSPTSAHGDWEFQNNSDGGVISGLPMPASWAITIAPQFQQGIGSWQYLDGSLRAVELALSGSVTITAFDSPSPCRANCTVPRCGDGILDGGEVCDDGNVVGGDGCSADCKALR